MSDQQVDNLIIHFSVIFGINVGNFLIHNYDKISGCVLTTLSIAYLIWKWVNEYKKSKIAQK